MIVSANAIFIGVAYLLNDKVDTVAQSYAILSLGIGSKLNTIIEEQNWLLIIIFFVFLVIFAYFLRIIEN